MAIIACKECGGKVSDTAVTCPHCGAAVATPKPAAPVVVPVEKKGNTWWMWVFGVPVGLFVLVMVIGSLNPDSPEKARDRRVYEQCRSDLDAADRARSSTATILAGVCERFRAEYVQKYKSTP